MSIEIAQAHSIKQVIMIDPRRKEYIQNLRDLKLAT